MKQGRASDTIITPTKCGVKSFQIDNGGVRCATNVIPLPEIVEQEAGAHARRHGPHTNIIAKSSGIDF
jgi:hypothetical protein